MAELRYDDRVAIVTGGGRGVERAYALLLASRGAKVVVNEVGGNIRGDEVIENPVADVVAEIKAAGGEAVAVTDTVATVAGGKAIIDAAMDNWGRLDILVPMRAMSGVVGSTRSRTRISSRSSTSTCRALRTSSAPAMGSWREPAMAGSS